jgi:thioredoxin reductase
MLDVIVVGGGPGGLLSGYLFQQNDIKYLVLERETVGHSFRKMRPDMILLSPAIPSADWTSLTLKQPIWELDGVRKPYPTRDDFVCYLERFAIDNSLLVKEHCPAEIIQRENSGFKVISKNGEYFSKYVVIATGFYARARYPRIPGIEDNPHVIHYADFFSCMAYQGKRVLVVGGGNSAAEIAIELSGVSDVTLKTRGPLRFFSETDDLGDIRGFSESVLKELIKFTIIDHVWDEDIRDIDGGSVTFDSGKVERFDKIILATGFLPDIPPLTDMEIQCGDNGVPLITNSGESVSAEGIFFGGSLAMFHSRCRFIHGFRNEMEKVMWAIFDRL